jgi:hypothetical protein
MNQKLIELLVDGRPHPAYSDEQNGKTAHDICSNCISTACCTGPEGPIALSTFDILRLSTSFNMSPVKFMQKFTQDKFPDDKSFRNRIKNEKDSTVTFLRRKKVTSDSPCLFTKYVKDKKGRPRITCSIYGVRGLNCRDFYYDGCIYNRATNELGTMVACAMENVNNGKLKYPEMVGTYKELISKEDKTINEKMLAFTLREAIGVFKYVNNPNYVPIIENNEKYQDKIEDKIYRLLNKRNLRHEEDTDFELIEEHLHENNSGLMYADLAYDMAKELNNLKTENTKAIFDKRYGSRCTFNVSLGKLKLISDSEINKIKNSMNLDKRGESYFDIMMSAFNHIINFTSWVSSSDVILEDEPALLPVELLTLWSNLKTTKVLTDNFGNVIDDAFALLLNKNFEVLKNIKAINNIEDMIYYGSMLTLLSECEIKWHSNKEYYNTWFKINKLMKMASKDTLHNGLYSQKNISEWTNGKYTSKRMEIIYDQILNIRYFQFLGLLEDNSEDFIFEFYNKATHVILNRIAEMNLNKNTVIDAYNIVTHIGYGLNQYGRMKLESRYDKICKRVNDSIWNIIDPAITKTGNGDDVELISEFCDATHTNLGFSRKDKNYLRIMDKVADSSPKKMDDYGQSWKGILEGEAKNQDEYLYTHLYHRAWTVIDAMRSYFD